MSSATTELAIPSLDELYRMTAVPDQRVVIRDVDWSFYERLVDSIPSRVHIHVDYDGKDLEIMSPSPVHDGARKLMGQLAEAVAQVFRIPYRSSGDSREKVSRSSSSGWGTTVRYHAVDESGFLPIRAEEVRRWVVDENSDDESAWAERLRAWVAAELAPRRAR